MKKMLMASAATLAMVGAASAEDVKLGILIGFTCHRISDRPHGCGG